MVWVLGILLTMVTITLIVALFYLYRFAIKLLELETQIDESLDMLDAHYRRLADINQTPVLSDEPIVRELAFIVRSCRDTILIIANKLTSFDEGTKTR